MDSEAISNFAVNQQGLLKQELQSELEETTLLTSSAAPSTLQKAGLALLNLTVAVLRTGYGGKTLVDLEADSAISSGELPEHGIRNGDIVSLQTQPSGALKKKAKDELKDKGLSAVVVKTSAKRVVVALDKEDAVVPEGRLWL
jgi:DNA polymerase alpha-associated DNA helicase A